MPTLTNSLLDAITQTITKHQADIHTALVAKVVAVNSKSVDAKPVTNRQFKGESIELPVFPDVPLITLQGGSSYIHLPVSAGDYCLLIVAERDIENWFDGLDNASPKTKRMHDYSDCFALVGINPEAGAISIPSTTTIQGDVIHNGKNTQTGDYDQTGDYKHQGNKEQTGTTIINGNLIVNASGGKTPEVSGDFKVDGSIEVTNDVTINGISFNAHVHPENDGGTTGTPQ